MNHTKSKNFQRLPKSFEDNHGLLETSEEDQYTSKFNRSKTEDKNDIKCHRYHYSFQIFDTFYTAKSQRNNSLLFPTILTFFYYILKYSVVLFLPDQEHAVTRPYSLT